MTTPDHLYRFVFERSNVRGEIVRLEDTYQEVLRRREYPPALRDLLGKAMAAAALLSATIKFRGSLSLQVQGRAGPLTLLLVQASSHGGLRALARWEGEVADGASLAELCPDGHLAITIEPEEGDRYQGLVDLAAGTLERVLDEYFRSSEQLATRVWLAADAERAAGMLVQRLPGEDPDADAWNRAETLAETIEMEELLHLTAPEIIRRLFHEEDVRLFDPEPFRFHCTCSSERVVSVLRSLGPEEVREILAEQGEIEVQCDFCNQAYRYDTVDVERLLLTDAETPPAPPTRH